MTTFLRSTQSSSARMVSKVTTITLGAFSGRDPMLGSRRAVPSKWARKAKVSTSTMPAFAFALFASALTATKAPSRPAVVRPYISRLPRKASVAEVATKDGGLVNHHSVRATMVTHRMPQSRAG